MNNEMSLNMLLNQQNPYSNINLQQLQLMKMISLLQGNQGYTGNPNIMNYQNNLLNQNMNNAYLNNMYQAQPMTQNIFGNPNIPLSGSLAGIGTNFQKPKPTTLPKQITNNFNIVNDNVFTARNSEEVVNIIRSLDPSQQNSSNTQNTQNMQPNLQQPNMQSIQSMHQD